MVQKDELFAGIVSKAFLKRATWKLKFALLPRKCFKSGKSIWLTTAYRGTMMITGPGTPVFERRWLTKYEYILYAIKGDISV